MDPARYTSSPTAVEDRSNAGEPSDSAAESPFEFPADTEPDREDSSRTDPVSIAPDDANVLLLGPRDSSVEHEHCAALSSIATGEPADVLLVEIGRPCEERVTRLRSALEAASIRVTVLAVGGPDVAKPWESIGADGDVALATEVVADSTDVRRIGLSISTFLSEQQGTDAAVCVHSLTELLALLEDSPRAFRFLHLLCGRIRDAGATAHYHLDPDAPTEQFLETIRPLFDRVVRYEPDSRV